MQEPKPPPPPHHVSPKGMWISKLAIRFVQFALASSLVGCLAYAFSMRLTHGITFVVLLPQAAVSVTWALAEGICILVRGGHRGMHPGANVALDLLLWLGLIAGTALSQIAASYPGDPRHRSIVATGRVILGLGVSLILLHFVTFVIACAETDQRNREADAAVAVTVAHYYPPLPYHHYQYPPVNVNFSGGQPHGPPSFHHQSPPVGNAQPQ
ncbi:hypothetical protein VTH06DRAFT_7392 [Thermothelomyces fergusii]